MRTSFKKPGPPSCAYNKLLSMQVHKVEIEEFTVNTSSMQIALAGLKFSKWVGRGGGSNFERDPISLPQSQMGRGVPAQNSFFQLFEKKIDGVGSKSL